MRRGDGRSEVMGAIRWGIMGAGNIAHRFAASLGRVEGCELAAIAGRSAVKLDSFAREFPVPPERRYADADGEGEGAYRSMVADPELDAVYLSLPHGMHARWACELLRAGKAVLCEKPATVSQAEARRVAECARETGSLFMEAMKMRFMPARDRVYELLASEELGAVTALTCVHRIDYGAPPAAYLLDPAQGGCLLDLGCYDVSWMCDLLDDPVSVESADVSWRAVNAPLPDGSSARVDWSDDVRLTAGGVPVHLDLSGGASEYDAHALIECEHGEIEIPMLHRPLSLLVRRAGAPDERVDAPCPDDFHGEIAHFRDLMRTGANESPVMPLAVTVRNARVIDAIRAAWPRAQARG